MNKIQEQKSNLRKEISSLKKNYLADELKKRSEEVLDVIEITGVFQEAKIILIYNSLNDEVQTADFIRKWDGKKEFYLPIVVNNELVFRKYASDTQFQQSAYGIMEPAGKDFANYQQIDLIIVPGLAFDFQKNRMGRGKGYYDRFLKKVTAPKMGICFDFQLLDKVPADDSDIRMDYIVSENELIW